MAENKSLLQMAHTSFVQHRMKAGVELGEFPHGLETVNKNSWTEAVLAEVTN